MYTQVSPATHTYTCIHHAPLNQQGISITALPPHTHDKKADHTRYV